MTLRAIVHKAEEGGFWAEVPALPGCNTQGETEEEIRGNLREAIELWFEAGDEVSSQNHDDKILELAI
jgi:predicted RNase H-like HicB family nuclease